MSRNHCVGEMLEWLRIAGVVLLIVCSGMLATAFLLIPPFALVYFIGRAQGLGENLAFVLGLFTSAGWVAIVALLTWCACMWRKEQRRNLYEEIVTVYE